MCANVSGYVWLQFNKQAKKRQMLKEAVKQFRAGRVLLVDEFHTSPVRSADNTPSETLLNTPPESFSSNPCQLCAKFRAAADYHHATSRELRSQVAGLQQLINNIAVGQDETSSKCALPHVSMQVAAASEKHGKAIPSPGPDVLNKHQQHHQ
ncbi:hypothetical protein QJQ45_022055, partial [Haematococcus lacustris]